MLKYYFGGICTLFKYNLNWLLLLDYIFEEKTVLFTSYNNLEKYIIFVFYLMHIKHGKHKLKHACLMREPMIIVFMHQAHTYLHQ